MPRPPAAPARPERLVAAMAVGSQPVAHSLARHAQQARDLDLRAPLADQPHRPPAKLLLGGLRQRASVPVHARRTTPKGQLFTTSA